MDHARDPFHSFGRQPDSSRSPGLDAAARDAIDGDENVVRGPGRERQLRPMRDHHTERFVVAPHRGAWGSGIWSVRRDGVLLAVHASQWEAMLDATELAYAEWSERGARTLVQFEEMDGRLVEARVFGAQRTAARVASHVVLSSGPQLPH